MKDFLQKIRNLADECEDTILNSSHEDDGAITARYILAGIRAFCEQEPSKEMCIAGFDGAYRPHKDGSASIHAAYRAMMQQALKELEARNAR